MAKYQIFTDSSSDLTPELRKQYGIEYFYFGLVVDGVEYRADLDWKDYSVEEFYGWLKAGKKVKTTQVSLEEVITRVRPYFEKGIDIIYLACSCKLTGSMNLFLLAKEQLMETYEQGYYVYGRKFSNERTTTKDIVELTNYIARYASHPAISERRITKCDIQNNLVTWFYDPHEDDDIEDEEKKIGRQYITEDVFKFMERLVLHVPDKGFQQIRYYGFYSNKFKNKISNGSLFSKKQLREMKYNTKWLVALEKAFGYNPTLCKCGNYMILDYELSVFPEGNSP